VASTTTVVSATTTTQAPLKTEFEAGDYWYSCRNIEGCAIRCSWFDTQIEAQEWFDETDYVPYIKTYPEIVSLYPDTWQVAAGVDTNNDGIACGQDDFESLTFSSSPKPFQVSPYREPSSPSMDRDLCKLEDQRGIEGFTYRETMIEGVDYSNRATNEEEGFVFLYPNYSGGFPLPSGMFPSIGSLPVAFVAIDFPDAPGSESQLETVQRVAEELNEYWDFQSNGKFQMDFTFAEQVFRVPIDSATFGLQVHHSPAPELTEAVLEIVDPHIDFTGINDIFMVTPEDITTIATDWHYPPSPESPDSNILETDESSILAWSGHGFVFSRNDIKARGGLAMFYVHETLHDMGITDLYLFENYLPGQIWKPGPTKLPMGEWDVMQDPNGHTREIISWHKWLLGWLEDEQIFCFKLNDSQSVDLSLSPLTRKSEGFKAAVIPISEKKVIVIESRRTEGYSSDAPRMNILVEVDGTIRQAQLRNFGSDGLLVYTYDTSAFYGTGPARMQIPDGRVKDCCRLISVPAEIGAPGKAEDDIWTNRDPDIPGNVIKEGVPDPLLRLGDYLIVDGITIELLEWSESADRVRISKQYGLWIDLPEDQMTTGDWVDIDGDGIDDRWQAGPGEPDSRFGTSN